MSRALVVALLPFVLLLRLDAQTHCRGTLRDEDVYHSPAPSAIPLLSLGYRRAAAALLWVQLLQYFGEQLGNHGHLRYLLDRVDSILAADPTFRDVYSWVSIAIVYNATGITRKDIEISNRYLARGIRRFPDDGELRYMLAFNYAIELPPWTEDVEQKRRWRRRAAQLFAEAAERPGAPADAAMMAVEMGKKGGSDALAVEYIRRLLDKEPDDAIRDRLIERLAMLTSEREARQADADRRRLSRIWERDWPYLPPALFALVGERLPPTAVDDDAEEEGEADEQEQVPEEMDAGGTADGADAGPD